MTRPPFDAPAARAHAPDAVWRNRAEFTTGRARTGIPALAFERTAP